MHRSSCEKWPRIRCAGHGLRPQPRLGLCSRHSPWLCPPPWRAQKWFPLGSVLRARVRRTKLPSGTAAAPVRGRCPAGECAFHPHPEPSRLAYFPWQAGDEEKNEVVLEIGESMLLAILGNVTVLGKFIAITRRVPHQQAGFPAATLASPPP